MSIGLKPRCPEKDGVKKSVKGPITAKSLLFVYSKSKKYTDIKIIVPNNMF
jgi:hypothetical protein